jgi:hypothetical protein
VRDQLRAWPATSDEVEGGKRSLTSEELSNQLPKVDPPLGDEVEGELSSIPLDHYVEKIIGQLLAISPAETQDIGDRERETNLEFGVDDLHRESLLLDFLLAEREGFRFVLHLEEEKSGQKNGRRSKTLALDDAKSIGLEEATY